MTSSLSLVAFTTFIPSASIFHRRPQFDKYLLCPRSFSTTPRTSCLHDTLSQAISAGHVLNFGREVQLDGNGAICRPALSAREIPLEIAALAELAVTLLQATFGNELHSVYIRGSHACDSTAERRISCEKDLDLIVLLHCDSALHKVSRVRALLQRKLHKEKAQNLYASVVGIDIEAHVLKSNDDFQHALSERVRFMLLAYAIPLYGTDVRGKLAAARARSEARILLADVRENVNRANKSNTLYAYQWALKRIIRGIVAANAHQTRIVSRDIVPCTRILLRLYEQQQQHEQIQKCFAHAASLICANERNNFSGIGDIVTWKKISERVLRLLAEIAEDAFLVLEYGHGASAFGAKTFELHETPFTEEEGNERIMQKFYATPAFHSMRAAISELCSLSLPFAPKLPELFVRDEHPILALHANQSVQESCQQPTTTPTEPLVYRNVVPKINCGKRLRQLLQFPRQVSVRVSPNNYFIYCRSEHKLVAEHRIFTPPSVLLQVRSDRFVRRLAASAETYAQKSPLFYKDAMEAERVYMQSKVSKYNRILQPMIQDFNFASSVRFAQAEREWICTHGAVSSLHYDSAYSALAQLSGKKRLILFPPESLGSMGMYPVRHPLHRRARVSLDTKDTLLLKEFWGQHAGKAVEVTLSPGDLLLFPAFWAHYTESYAEEEEVCIARTIRFLTEET